MKLVLQLLTSSLSDPIGWHQMTNIKSITRTVIIIIIIILTTTTATPLTSRGAFHTVQPVGAAASGHVLVMFFLSLARSLLPVISAGGITNDDTSAGDD